MSLMSDSTLNLHPLATPLVLEVIREAIHAGAHPATYITLPGAQEILLTKGSDSK